MTTPAFEAFLARLYTDASALERFLRDPHGEARNAGLTGAEQDAVAAVNRDALIAAAHGFDRKRSKSKPKNVPLGLIARLKRWGGPSGRGER